jgi:hypothetical protein
MLIGQMSKRIQRWAAPCNMVLRYGKVHKRVESV